MENKKKIILPMVMILLLIIVTVSVTFAAFTFSKQGSVENTLETGTVTLTYTEGKTGITLNETYPMSDEKGKVLVGENNVFDFTVQANLSRTMSIGYEVTAIKLPITDVTPLKDDEVKLYLERAIDPDTNYSEVFSPSHFVPRDEQTEIGSPVGSMILDSGIFTNAGITIHNYRLRMWIDENAQIPSGESRKYGVKINVYAKQDVSVSPVESANSRYFTFDVETGTILGYSDDGPKDLVIPSTIKGVEVKAIGANAFKDKGLTSLSIPNTVTSIGDGAFNNNQLNDEQGLIYQRKSDGNIDYTTVVSYGGANKDNITIPNGVTTIKNSAFQSVGLNSVTFPETLTSIGISSFQNNNLTTVTIPKNVTYIGVNAFLDNPLTDINDESGNDFDWVTITGRNDVTVKVPRNKNISNIWKYDTTKNSSTFCVTGEESTCVQIPAPETYEAGTIIKYKVNDTKELYFHVMFDNGDTLTMQQRENTLYSIAWYASANDNSKGPLTVLPALENATSGWTNVLDQTYTLGTTIFKDNAYTGCTRNTSYTMLCSAKTYTLENRTAKSRMITVQEANTLGCSGKCPIWMFNYLSDSTKRGGTVNQSGGTYGNNYGYWMMNAYSGRTTDGCYISCDSIISMHSANSIYMGARAVVVIKK